MSSILIAFSENCGYSLILHQSSTSGSFIKITFNVDFETISAISINFSYYVTLKSIGLPYTSVNLLPMNDFITSSTDILGNIDSLNYADLSNIDTVHYTVSKNHIHEYYHCFHQKSLEVVASCQVYGGGASFPNSSFCLKSQMLSFSTRYCSYVH